MDTGRSFEESEKKRERKEPKRGKRSRVDGTIGAFRSQRLAVNNDSNSSSANMDSPLTP